MKHIIVEGVDICGKSSLIQHICSTADNYTIRHFKKPLGNTNIDKVNYQKQDFISEFSLSLMLKKDEKLDYLIWDRSHIGEAVYSPMYRKSDSDWIWAMEKFFFEFNSDNVYLILLYGDADFLIKRENGDSLSAKLEDRQSEINLFHYAFDKSIIKNKLKIKVNSGDNYISREIINKQVDDFLK